MWTLVLTLSSGALAGDLPVVEAARIAQVPPELQPPPAPRVVPHRDWWTVTGLAVGGVGVAGLTYSAIRLYQDPEEPILDNPLALPSAGVFLAGAAVQHAGGLIRASRFGPTTGPSLYGIGVLALAGGSFGAAVALDEPLFYFGVPAFAAVSLGLGVVQGVENRRVARSLRAAPLIRKDRTGLIVTGRF